MTEPDDLIPLARAGRVINPASPPHTSTVVRWVCRGVGTPPIKLATVKVGGRRFTTRSALRAFVAATSGTGSMVPQPGDRRRAAEVLRAEHELDAEGIA